MKYKFANTDKIKDMTMHVFADILTKRPIDNDMSIDPKSVTRSDLNRPYHNVALEVDFRHKLVPLPSEDGQKNNFGTVGATFTTASTLASLPSTASDVTLVFALLRIA